MTVAELRKFLESYKDDQEVKIATTSAYEITVAPIPVVEAEPVVKTEGENIQV